MYTLNKYDTEKYNFIQLIAEIFGVNNLSTLHKSALQEYKEQFQVGFDSSTEFHKKFYDKYRVGWPEMIGLYERFIADVVSKDYNEDFLYQAFPTFRVHLPSHVAVGAFHTDAEFQHPEGEMNYILPLTDARDTASVWVETSIGSNYYHSMVMLHDHLIQFNGNQLRHGNHINLTNGTRVSLDFRILSISKYNPENGSESVTRKTKFTEGEYYKRFSK